MAEISKITLPSGTTYDLKDAVAREAIASGFSYVISTEAATTPKGVVYDNSGTSVTGTLEASASTKGIFYLVPSTKSASGDLDIYDEYITVGTSTYIWEKLGNTQIDIRNLGSLAYKSSATGSVTPSGTVSAPTITVTADTASKYVASSVDGGGSVTAGSAASCTLPSLNMTVSDETLAMLWSAGSFKANTPTEVTLPTFTSQTIATGIKSATSSQPTFTGNSSSVTVS